MNLFNKALCRTAPSIFLAGAALCSSQTPVTLQVSAENLTRYPSLQPAAAVLVQLAQPAPVFDLMENVLSGDHPWDCTKPSSYRISVVSKQKDGSLKPLRNESILAVALQGNEDGKKQRLTHCEIGDPPSVELIFRTDLAPTETVQVFLLGLPGGRTAQSDGTLKFTQSLFSISAVPQDAPSEKLINGETRNTGQLNLSLSDSNVFTGLDAPFNIYVKSKNLFSTDERDSQSAFSGTIGIQRGILPAWYAPLHLEETIQGNQIATNLSNLTSLGITTLLPWAWSGRLFNNPIVRAALPPDITINSQYTYRINQNVAPPGKPLAANDFSLNPFASWSSIRFPWACTVFAWIHLNSKASPDQSSGAYCLGTELNIGVYYLPLDLTPAEAQRVEGYGDVSILIPLQSFRFASSIFPYLTPSDPAKSQIRIKYADSVNAASNYARSKQWTFGIELIK